MTAIQSEPTRRLPRAQRRQQILDAATRAFARAGFANTGLDAIAAEAGVTQAILYRHFASKADLYRAVVESAHTRLYEAVGADHFDDASIPALVRAAGANPDAFRLLFQYATREPEFHDLLDTMRSGWTEMTRRNLAGISDERWRSWAARLLPTLATEAVIAWLDAGQPDPDRAAGRIRHIVDSVLDAADPHPPAQKQSHA